MKMKKIIAISLMVAVVGSSSSFVPAYAVKGKKGTSPMSSDGWVEVGKSGRSVLPRSSTVTAESKSVGSSKLKVDSSARDKSKRLKDKQCDAKDNQTNPVMRSSSCSAPKKERKVPAVKIVPRHLPTMTPGEDSKADPAKVETPENKSMDTTIGESMTDLYSGDGLMDFHEFNVDTLKYLFEGLEAKDFEGKGFIIITGRENHSVDGTVIREEVLEKLKELKIPAEIDSKNDGVVKICRGSDKIPEELISRYELLKKLLKSEKTDYDELARSEKGQKALIAYGKIPGDQQNKERLKALETVIRECAKGKEGKDEYEKAAKEVEGREALIAYGKIPHDTITQIAALESVIRYYGSNEKAAKEEDGREALIAYGKVPQRDENKRLTALEAVIKHYGSNEKAAKEVEGREALIAYGKIPQRDKDKRLTALKAVINHYGGYERAAEKTDSNEAMLMYLSIPVDRRDRAGNKSQYDMAIVLMDKITGKKFSDCEKSFAERKKYFDLVKNQGYGYQILRPFNFKCKALNKPFLQEICF